MLLPWFLFFLAWVQAASIAQCSTQNTGVFSQSSLYQSNSLCINSCVGYAFAIVSYKDCYCLDYAPSSSSDSEECQKDCPGYPSEKCGGDGYYAYIQIGSPSGTSGISSQSESLTSSTSSSDDPTPSASSASSASSSKSPATVSPSTSSTVVSVQPSTVAVTVTSTASPVLVTSTRTALPTNSKGETVTSLIVVTQPDSSVHTTVIVRTSVVQNSLLVLFITSYISASRLDPSSLTTSSSSIAENTFDSLIASVTSEPPTHETSTKKSFWDLPGKVGGTFAVVGLVALVLIGLIFFACLRRFARGQVMTPSQSGLIADSAGSMLLGLPMEKGLRFITDGENVIPVPIVADVDHRLDPGQMFYNNLGVEEESKKSISDEHDYLRKFLRVANPDLGLRSSISKNTHNSAQED